MNFMFQYIEHFIPTYVPWKHLQMQPQEEVTVSDVFLFYVSVCLQTAVSQSIYHGIICRADNQFTIKEKILIFKLFTFISLFKGYVYNFIILN